MEAAAPGVLNMFINLASVNDPSFFEKSFFWPVAEPEKDLLYDRLVAAGIALIDNETDQLQEEIIRVFVPYLILYFFTVYMSQRVIDGFKQRGERIDKYTPSPIDFYSWLINGTRLDARFFVKRPVSYADPKTLAKYAIRKLLWRPTQQVLLNSNITVESYLKMNGVRFFRSKTYDWFSPFDRFEAPVAVKPVLGGKIFGYFRDAAMPMTVSDEAQKHLKDFIDYSVAFIAGTIGVLKQKSLTGRVRRLYTATQGAFSTRVVSTAVKSQGGTVCAFPHGGGFFWVDFPGYWLVEQLTASTFFCYTQAERIGRERQAAALKRQPTASLEVLPDNGAHRTGSGSYGRIRRVMFLSGSFSGDRTFVGLLSEIQRFDLEVRIVKELLACGLKVVVKFHRKSRALKQQTAFFSQMFGGSVEIMDTPLTEMLRRGCAADAFVSENITGGSLVEVMKTDKPVILFTPHPYLLSEDVREQFLRRVRMFVCRMDENNRAVFDKDEVHAYFRKESYSYTYDLVNRFTNSQFEY